MKKVFLFAACATMMFAACSSDDNIAADQVLPGQTPENGAVQLDAYMGRATTRAGKPGDLTNTVMRGAGNAIGDGFGVFAYYTNNNDYDQLAIPNFMWNQKVTAKFASAAAEAAFQYWQYEPLKYWPNEYGNNAISDDNDKVTFFAYAPYVDVETSGKLKAADIAAGKDKWGITSMTRNVTAGDPIIKYIASFNKDQAVDLCWGVCQNSDWQLVQTGQAQDIDLGKPWLNVQRPADASALSDATGQKVKFQFRHALAKMHIDINAFVDGYDNSKNLDDKTRIWVRSVRFTGFTMKGALNLNNETPNQPYWMNYNGIGDLVADGDVIVYDGRKDGKEGVSGAIATNEKVLGLNPQLIQDENQISGTPAAWVISGGSQRTGVQKNDGGSPAAAQQLFENGGIFYVIPTGDKMSIEIVYDVETINSQLGTTVSDSKTAGSTIENRISKTIEFGNGNDVLEAGKAYDIHLHLGMNSVKFDADVVAWEDMAAPDIDLPANMPAYAAKTTLGTIDIPGDATEFVFAVTGLKGGEAVTAATTLASASAKVYSKSDFATEDSRANASGVAYVKVTSVTANTTIADKNNVGTVTITPIITTGGAEDLTVNQKAQPLGLTAPESPATGHDFTLRRTISGAATAWTTANTACPDLGGYIAGSTTNNYVRVWRNGAELTWATSPTIANQFSLANATGQLRLGTSAASGETIKVTIKAGNVPEETITFTVP